jgi:hypothetical protein
LGAGAEALLHCPTACGAAVEAALCTDDAIWRDEHEDGCARWADAAYDCSKATEGAGYISLAGQAQLLQRCPLACGLCPARHAEVWPSCAAAAAPYAPRQLCDPTSDNEVICNGQNACPDCGCGSDPPASSCIREGGIRAAGWPDSSDKAFPRYDACECPALAEERVGDPVPGLIVSGVVLVLGGACFYAVGACDHLTFACGAPVLILHTNEGGARHNGRGALVGTEEAEGALRRARACAGAAPGTARCPPLPYRGFSRR